jgi:hypothetical protein
MNEDMILQSIKNVIKSTAYYFQKSLGIYFSENFVHIVEVKKYFKKCKITNTVTCSMNDDILTIIENEFGFKDKVIAVNFNPEIASYRLIKIPEMDKSEIDGWINENRQNFLPQGISATEVSIDYKIVKHNGSFLMLFMILQKEEIEKVNKFLDHKNLNLALISPGLTQWGLLKSFGHSEPSCVFIKRKGTIDVMVIQDNGLLYYNQMPEVFQVNKDEPLYLTAYNLFENDFKLLKFVPSERNSGEFVEEEFYPADSSPEHSPAHSLALASLKTGKNQMNLIASNLRSKLDSFIWKQAFLKTAIGLILCGFSLYIILIFMSLEMTQLSVELDNSRSALMPYLDQISELKKKQTQVLMDRTDARSVSMFRSNKELILTIISFHIPEGCWLYKLQTNGCEKENYNTVLKGMGTNRTIINTFFGNLESDKNIKKIKLDYINTVDQDRMYRDWKIRGSDYIDFQFSLTF